MTDLTQYFVCKVCGNICLKTDAADDNAVKQLGYVGKKRYVRLSIATTSTGNGAIGRGKFIFEDRYCLDCIDYLAWYIAQKFGCFSDDDLITWLKQGYNLHPILKLKVEEYFKRWSCEYSTIEEAFQYRDKVEADNKKVESIVKNSLKTKNKFLSCLFGK